jgi:hypothetical protein
LAAFEQGVVEEERSLRERLFSLTRYLEDERFLALPDEEQILLSRQADAMETYAAILKERIERFE